MTQKTVRVRLWTVEKSKGWLVWYQIEDGPAIPLHGKYLSDEARAKRCVGDAAVIIQKSLSTYKSIMGWFNNVRDFGAFDGD